MQELAEFILHGIVEDPDAVLITKEEENGNIYLKAEVADEDMGRVIGKNGKVIRAIRNLLKAAARKRDIWVNFELVE